MAKRILARKKILVTGGAGFIGSHLIEALLKEGDSDVVSLDNYSTGKKENHKKGAIYIEGDTCDIEKLITVKPDLVYHLGEYSRVEKSFDDIEKVWRSNKDGTFAVLEFCRKHTVKIVYAGSSTKFGDGGLGRDQSPYAWTKATNTELVQNYGNWFGLSYSITYFYNVYGPGEIGTGAYATVVGIFCEKFRNGMPLTVVTPGTQVRNFTHVSDIVSGLLSVGKSGQGDDYGLGCEKAYSILELAEMFGGEIEMLPPRAGNRMGAAIDTRRARNELGWKSKESIEKYIKNFLASTKKKK